METTVVDIALLSWTHPVTGATVYATEITSAGAVLATTEGRDSREMALADALRLANQRLWRLSPSARSWY